MNKTIDEEAKQMYTGCMEHWSPAGHKEVVEALRWEIEHVMGWEHPLEVPPPYYLVKRDVECRSGDTNMQYQESVQACAYAVKANGGEFFVFGKGSKFGKCYQ